jgi:crotonobetaine/carnitine-CoA ligase
MTHESAPAWLPEARARFRRIEAMPLPASVAALLDEAADDCPEGEAWRFIAGGASISFGALRARVNALANGLRAIGVERGTHVGVMLPNIPEFPVTWLALARIGAVMVPVNLRSTGRELHFVLSDSQATHLVIAADKLPVLADMPAPAAALYGRVVAVGEAPAGLLSWDGLLHGQPETCAASEPPGLDDPLNIQYTSGTTGLPKGCLQTHRYWLTCARAYAECDGQRYRRVLSANPFFYMTPQWLLVLCLMQRAALVVAPHPSLTRYVGWVREHAIDYCYFPADVLAHTPPRPDDRDNAMIRANLSIHRAEQHVQLERRFGFPVRAAFGMTEIGLGLIMPMEAAEMTGSGSCGMAAPFRACRVADAEGATLPPGTPGELLIRGPGLFRGYWNRPEATAASFHGDWFRTGDLATMDAQGFVRIVGRLKEMIRRSGENISATEIETVLLGLPGVVEAAALPVPDEYRGEEVKAVVVLAPGVTPAALPPERIVAHCRAGLAAFKVPRFIAYRTAPLPRSTSGKVQKPALLAETTDPRAGCWDRLAEAGAD